MLSNSKSILSQRSKEGEQDDQADDDKKKDDCKESIAGRSAISIAKSKTRSVITAGSRKALSMKRQFNQRQNKSSRHRDENAFETKSLVSQRSTLTKERKREDRSLHILTKRALNQLKGESLRKEDINMAKNYLSRSYLQGRSGAGGMHSSIVSQADSKERKADDISESSTMI